MSKAYRQIPVVVATEVTPVYGDHHDGEEDYLTPTGRWKDGLCDCCSLGCCHPSLWCAYCFPQILMGQILTRMKLSWLGDSSPASDDDSWRTTFRRVVTVVILYYVLISYLSPPPTEVVEEADDDNDNDKNKAAFLGLKEIPLSEEDYPHWKRTWLDILNFLFYMYTIIVLVKLRLAVRDRYRIPGSTCEDCCCVVWCGCCTVAQLARQTAQYDTERAACCSSTGLAPLSSSSSSSTNTSHLIPAMVV
jgi:Cys-rich protein (TIGR01571 family)